MQLRNEALLTSTLIYRKYNSLKTSLVKSLMNTEA
jgi:hypothetical protein